MNPKEMRERSMLVSEARGLQGAGAASTKALGCVSRTVGSQWVESAVRRRE